MLTHWNSADSKYTLPNKNSALSASIRLRSSKRFRTLSNPFNSPETEHKTEQSINLIFAEAMPRLRKYDIHAIFNALFYLVKTGCPLMVHTTPANIHHTKGALPLLMEASARLPSLAEIKADQGYRGCSIRESVELTVREGHSEMKNYFGTHRHVQIQSENAPLNKYLNIFNNNAFTRHLFGPNLSSFQSQPKGCSFKDERFWPENLPLWR